MKFYPVTVVENFYEDPDAIRNFALAQEFKFCHELPHIDYVFPGSRTEDLRVLNNKLYEDVCKKLVSIFHNPKHDYMRWIISTSFQNVSEQYGRGVIHKDDNTVFAGVLYLTPNAPLESGTSLFKHNATFDPDKYTDALKQNDEKFKAHQPISADYHHMFDEVVRVNNVYNTLIIYEGDTFHAANNFFGTTLHDSRLTQVFFVNRVDAQRADAFPLNRANEIKI